MSRSPSGPPPKTDLLDGWEHWVDIGPLSFCRGIGYGGLKEKKTRATLSDYSQELGGDI